MEAHLVSMLLVYILYLVRFSAAETFQCYSCSYTRSSAPEVGYECVNNPNNVTHGQPVMSCQTPRMCVTKAVLYQKHIRSVTRGCLPQQEHCTGDKCCNNDGIYPSCEHKCRSDQCNGLNAEMWIPTDNGPSDGHNEATKYTSDFSAVLAMSLCTILILKS